MNPSLSLPLAALLTISTGALAADRDRIQGTWILVSETRGGSTTPPDGLKGRTMVFDGSTVRSQEGGEGEFALDTARSPKRIDWKMEGGRTLQGIYRFEGDLLRTCVDEEGRGRPSDLDGPPEPGQAVRIWRRKG
jgi:uncharacterized protein (TIGR03067 family)